MCCVWLRKLAVYPSTFMSVLKADETVCFAETPSCRCIDVYKLVQHSCSVFPTHGSYAPLSYTSAVRVEHRKEQGRVRGEADEADGPAIGGGQRGTVGPLSSLGETAGSVCLAWPGLTHLPL